MEETAPSGTGPQVTVKSVGYRQLAWPGEEFLLQNFKWPLKVAIPYQRETAGMYEPLLQWYDDRAMSVAIQVRGVRALLATLNPRLQGQTLGEGMGEVWDSGMPGANFALLPVSNLICKASGLTAETLDAALSDLQGVILGTPAGWSDAYRFNLREAVLGAGFGGFGCANFCGSQMRSPLWLLS